MNRKCPHLTAGKIPSCESLQQNASFSCVQVFTIEQLVVRTLCQQQILIFSNDLRVDLLTVIYRLFPDQRYHRFLHRCRTDGKAEAHFPLEITLACRRNKRIFTSIHIVFIPQVIVYA